MEVTVEEVPEKPLDDAELAELVGFLKLRFPDLHKEVMDILENNLRTQLPSLLRILHDDMRRFQAGQETRHVVFWTDAELAACPIKE